jgi:hypothetical protein
MLSFLSGTSKAKVRKYFLGPFLNVVTLLCYPLYTLIPTRFWRLHRPIFIIGCPRSGTTLFVDMFSRHRDLANWSEAGQILQRHYYDPNIDHLMEEADLRAFDAARIAVLFKLCLLLRRRKRFVNKSPRNSLRIRYLKSIYPDAIFIHLVRDGRAVAFSNANETGKEKFREGLPFGGFCKPPNWRRYLNLASNYVRFAYQWFEITEYIQKTARDFLADGEYIELRYEDFCAKPHESLEKLDRFCGLPSQGRLYGSIPDRFDVRNHKWRKAVSPQDVLEMEKVMSDLLTAHGYPLSSHG